MLKTVSIIVSGRVQGVFYRQSAKEKAVASGITGEVQNRPDGTVHIIATGEEKMLDQFILWCHTGPARASVTDVSVTTLDRQEFEKFTIKR
jgi:acylphosphatase